MTKPVVKWNKPNETPVVPVGEAKEFWVSAKLKIGNNEKITVFVANFVNMPVNIDDNGNTDTDNHLVDVDGEPLNAVGWHSNKSHYDFDDFYEPIFKSENQVLLGWADFEKPEFKGF